MQIRISGCAPVHDACVERHLPPLLLDFCQDINTDHQYKFVFVFLQMHFCIFTNTDTNTNLRICTDA